MMPLIEVIVINHLESAFQLASLSVPVYAERPDTPPDEYVLIEKTGSDEANHIASATIAIQSYASTMFEAATLNQAVKRAMRTLIESGDVSKCSLNSDYNYTDEETKKYRYQAVFDIVYFEEE